MEKMLCTSCGATLTPDVSAPFLTCAYCDTAVPNPHYDGTAAPEEPDLAAQCVATLLEMGEGELKGCASFGRPLQEAYAAREALEIPGDENVYLVYAHSTIWRTFSEGFAMADSGVYYLDGSNKGRRTWEAFITGGVSAVDRAGRSEDGALTLGACTFPINSDEDSKLARFVCDFYRCMYQRHTGQAAPAAWQEAPAAASVGQTVAKATVAGTVLNAAGNLLRRAIVQRAVQRPTLQHPAVRREARRPAMPAGRVERPARPSPIQPTRLQPPGARHQPRSAHPAGQGRPGSTGRLGGRGGRGPGGRGPGGIGGPGRGRR